MTPPQRRQDTEIEAVLTAARISRQAFLGVTEHMREAHADALEDARALAAGEDLAWLDNPDSED